MTRYLPADAANRALDRVLQVEGTIEGIRKAEDFTVLGGIKKELVVDFYVGQLGHQSLTCHFSKKNHAQLARLSKGQYIAVKGVCRTDCRCRCSCAGRSRRE